MSNSVAALQQQDIDSLLNNISLQQFTVKTDHCGEITVYGQGDRSTSEVNILTVHDMGCNHTSWIPFTAHPSMNMITSRAYFIHVCLPGQDDNAPDLPENFSYPSMQQIGEDLINVVHHLQVTNVLCVGEGAGANICARFAMAHPDYVDGVVLVHCTGTTAGFMESVKDKVINWKLQYIGMNPTAESYLVLHRFGSAHPQFEMAENKDDLDKAIKHFYESLRTKINAKNLRHFIDTFLKRTNIAEQMHKLKVPALFVTGDKASHNHTVHTLYSAAVQQAVQIRNKMELVEVNDVANVIYEATDKLAEAILYFSQGIGRLATLPMSHIPKHGLQYRTLSMAEADLPKILTIAEEHDDKK